MLEEKWWENGDHSVILERIMKKRLNDKGRFELRPDWIGLPDTWSNRQEDDKGPDQ